MRLQRILELLQQNILLDRIDLGQVGILLAVPDKEEFQVLILSLEALDYARIIGYVVLDIQNVPVGVRFDCFGPVRVHQCVVSVLKRAHGRRYICYHHCSAVATQ